MTEDRVSYLKVIFASAVGGVMEYYDFVLFILFAGIISEVFISPHEAPFLALVMTYGMFAAGYFVRPLGGIILAHFGDKSGRKKVFTLTVFLMAVPTFIIGILPTYAQIGILSPILLLIMRLCQGLAVGGEIPAAATFVHEHMSENKKAIGLTSLFSGLLGGIVLASLLGALVSHSLSKESLHSWGWRIPFIIGGLLGAIGIYIRTKLSESPVFVEIQKMKKQPKIPIIDVLGKHIVPVITGIFTTMFIASAFTTYYMFIPSFVAKTYNYSYGSVLFFNMIGLCMFLISMIIWAKIIDKKELNIKIPFILSALTVIIFSIPFFKAFATGNGFLIFIMYLIFAIGFGPGVGIFTLMLTKSFPGNVRFTGVSVAYNISFALFGGLTPLINTVLIKELGTFHAPAYYAIVAGIIGIIAAVASDINEKEII